MMSAMAARLASTQHGQEHAEPEALPTAARRGSTARDGHERRREHVAGGDDARALGLRAPRAEPPRTQARCRGRPRWRDPARSMSTRQPVTRSEESADRHRPCRHRRCPQRANARSSENRPISSAPIGTSARLGRVLLARAASAEPTAMPTVNTTSATIDDALVAADGVLDQHRQQRQHHRADEPEPRRDQAADPQPAVAVQMPEQRHRRRPRVAIDGEPGRGGAGLGNERGREPAQRCQHRRRVRR